MTQPYPGYQPPPRKKMALWIKILIGVGCVFFAMVGCGIMLNPDKAAVNQIGKAPAVPAAATPDVPKEPATTIGNGMWAVGIDIKPGMYRNVGERRDGGFFSWCSWKRLSSPDAVIDEGYSQEGKQVFVTIKPTDKFFESKDCTDWILV